MNGQITDQDIKSIANHLNSIKQTEDDQAVQETSTQIDINDLLELIGSVSPGRPTSVNVPSRQDQDLTRELLKLQREKDDDNDFLNEKIRQLKRSLQHTVSEKEEAVEEAKQMEIQKIRLEKLLKQSLGKGDGSPDDVI